ncbi:hypothetical protein SK128_002084 [Halocaridina rubra]|uniref:Uncharacterized protein n=1 Tax=Halocaridina rubra TaxID=373956 RepID=A0AAN9ADL1_HALRR
MLRLTSCILLLWTFGVVMAQLATNPYFIFGHVIQGLDPAPLGLYDDSDDDEAFDQDDYDEVDDSGFSLFG